ncbi:MAG: hypothetical protein JXM69_09360 [Anaerolineae bacterium]|nr:hypothetical protein [Anaerolineae bacterium]
MKKQRVSEAASQRPNNLSSSRLFRNYAGLFVALAVYLVLAFSYFFIVPIFEGPDEWTHTGHVKYIAKGNGLPVMLPGQGIWGGQQPPLYYAVGALLVQPFDLDGVAEYEENRRNPHAAIGYALDLGNKNNYLHPADENFPYWGLALTVHVLRLYSMMFGLVAIIFTYLTALELFDYQVQNSRPTFPSSPFWPYSQFTIRHSQFTIPTSYLFATMVALFVAGQPMFGFITASVANEPANIAFCAIGLWLAQRYVIRGPGQRWGRAVALGITLGLISLSKMTGLAFGLVAVIALLITSITTRKQLGAARLLWRDGLIIGLLFLLVGGWWYWRNYQLYGDFFQRGLYKIYFNVDPQPLNLGDFLYVLSSGEVSFWAVFGWLNIAAPEWAYSVYRIISRIGVLGVAFAFFVEVIHQVRSRRRVKSEAPQETNDEIRSTHYLSAFLHSFSPLWLHLTFPAILAFSLTRLVATEGGMQGRQLLPALGSIAIIIGWGWWMLVPRRLRRGVILTLVVILLAIAVWLPYTVVASAYLPRPLLTESDLPANLPRLDLTYHDEMKLMAVEVKPGTVHPGERVSVTAYWQALKPMGTNYSVFVHLIGRDYTNVGLMNTYPALGLRPTTTLAPGQIVKDTYPVLVNGGSAAPTRLLVNMGLFDFKEAGRPGIQPVDRDGQPASPTVGQLKLVPGQWPATEATPPLAEFADHIWLLDYTFQNCESSSRDCHIVFTWLAQGRRATDYTVFIQLWRDNEFIAGFDTPPLNNNYPTSLWDAGEIIIDPHLLDLSTLSAGEYQVLAGFYNYATGERLSVMVNGEPLPDYAIDLGIIEIR